MSKLMVEVKPDAVLVLGDTNSCLSVIGAKRLHIPIFHMEAGNRGKDECLPEETNRRIVDIISDVNRRQAESSAELARVLPRREGGRAKRNMAYSVAALADRWGRLGDDS